MNMVEVEKKMALIKDFYCVFSIFIYLNLAVMSQLSAVLSAVRSVLGGAAKRSSILTLSARACRRPHHLRLRKSMLCGSHSDKIAR